MAPTSFSKGLEAMAEEARPSWTGAKAAADATSEARIIDFMVNIEFWWCVLIIILWGNVRWLATSS